MSSFRKKQDILRYTGGYYDEDGIWQDGSYETITIYASVQPLNAEEKQQYSNLAPEGAAEYRAVKIYSDSQLIPAHQETGEINMEEADILVWRGRKYKVCMCEEWQSDVINHFRMIAWEVDVDATSNTEISP